MPGEFPGEPCVAASMRPGGLQERRGLGEAALADPDPGQVDQVLGIFRIELDRPLQRLLRLDPELGLDHQEGAKRMQWPILREDCDRLAAQRPGGGRVFGLHPGDALTHAVLAQSPDLRLGDGRGGADGSDRARGLWGLSRHAQPMAGNVAHGQVGGPGRAAPLRFLPRLRTG